MRMKCLSRDLIYEGEMPEQKSVYEDDRKNCKFLNGSIKHLKNKRQR